MCRERPEAAKLAKAQGSPGCLAMAGPSPARPGTAVSCPPHSARATRGGTGAPWHPHTTTLAHLLSARLSANANCLFPLPPDLPPSSFFFYFIFFFSAPPPPPSVLSSSWVKNNQVSGKQQLLLRCLPALAPENRSALGSGPPRCSLLPPPHPLQGSD